MLDGLRYHYKAIATAGFAIFSMFFGAGNLLFPLNLGAEAPDSTLASILGLGLTGVGMTFLGLLSIILYQGDKDAFFNSIGKKPAFVLSAIMLALMGPFGAIPRCIVVSHASFDQWLGGKLPFWLFGLVFCLATALAIKNYSRIIPLIGKVLTPFLLVFLGALCIASFTGNIPVADAVENQALNQILCGEAFIKALDPVADAVENHTLSQMLFGEAFVKALETGYQTLDLLATFFFCGTVIRFFKDYTRNHTRPASITALSLLACLLGCLLLGLIYGVFIHMGSLYAPYLLAFSPSQRLVALGEYTLGSFALPLVSFTLFFACLTTVAVLVLLFGDFLKTAFFKQASKKICLGITLGLSYGMSLLGFDTIFQFLGEVLFVLYPGIITLTLCHLVSKMAQGLAPSFVSSEKSLEIAVLGLRVNYKQALFWLAVVFSLLFKFQHR